MRSFYWPWKSIWCGLLQSIAETTWHYGVRGIANDWFKSYLTNCCQFVSINGLFQLISLTLQFVYELQSCKTWGFSSFSLRAFHLELFHFAHSTCLPNAKVSIKEIKNQLIKTLNSFVLLKWQQGILECYKNWGCKGITLDAELKLKFSLKKNFHIKFC